MLLNIAATFTPLWRKINHTECSMRVTKRMHTLPHCPYWSCVTSFTEAYHTSCLLSPQLAELLILKINFFFWTYITTISKNKQKTLCNQHNVSFPKMWKSNQINPLSLLFSQFSSELIQCQPAATVSRCQSSKHWTRGLNQKKRQVFPFSLFLTI